MSDEFLGEIIRKASWQEKAGKLGRVASTAALLAAPFTGGMSALGAAGLRAAGGAAAKRGAAAATKRGAAAGKAGKAASEEAAVLRDRAKNVKRPVGVENRSAEYYRNQRVAADPSLRPDVPDTTLDDFGVFEPPHDNMGQPFTGEYKKPFDVDDEGPLPHIDAEDELRAKNYARTQAAREAKANKRAEGFTSAADEQMKIVEEQQNIANEAAKEAKTMGEQAAADRTSATELGLVGVQSQQQSAAQRSAEDRQRREEDYERAREAASTGGAQSTTG
tara:strand:+ start:1365 stop:2195 length:831 start_codon:yes stop_codon:yes gene_type:complete